MKANLSPLGMRAAALLLALLVVTAAAGCGNQNGQANQLIDQVNGMQATQQQRTAEVDKLLAQAVAQSTAGQLDAEKASLAQAQKLLDQIIADAGTMKAKVDRAAALNISDTYRQYLHAKSRSFDALIKLQNVNKQYIALLSADPARSNPQTNQQLTDLQQQSQQLLKAINDADSAANRIASQHASEME